MPSQLDRATIRANLDKFGAAWSDRIEGWRKSGQQHTEKSFAQQYWSDLLRCFGVIPERIDLFERDAKRATTGGTGYIDFFWSSVAIGEAKSLDVDLDAAFEQALDYLSGGSLGQHEWPKYVLVTNFEYLRIDRLGEEPWSVTFVITEVADHLDQLRFLTGEETVTKREEEQASIAAAKLMASIYTSMLGEDADTPVGIDAPANPDEEDDATEYTSVLMTRLLFLLYGDDAGLWEEDLFYRWMDQETSPSSLGPQLGSLFQVLNTPAQKRSKNLPDLLAKFPYVNGSIFSGELPTEYFTPETREALLSACRFRWTQISPAVFGSMFQLVKSREARRASGEHYTSESNILKTIGPLFLDAYRAEVDRLTQNKSTTLKELEAFLTKLSTDIFCDPACGSGNFLNLAYAKLREIETALIVEKRNRSLRTTGTLSMDVTIDQRLSIDQFYGFELNWWPAKIAETAMFLVDHQSNRRLAAAIGQAPDRLPITITAHIKHCDALLLDWTDAIPATAGQTYLFGNPPFAGHKEQDPAQKAGLQKAWNSTHLGHLDYVTGWFAKAADFFVRRNGRFAYVSTNSITQGEPVAALFNAIFDRGWRLRFAFRTFKWDSEAPGKAAVHCVITGFDREASPKPRLCWSPNTSDERFETVTEISPYLLPGPPTVAVKPRGEPLSAMLSPLAAGSTPIDWGGLVVDEDQYSSVVQDAVAAKYLRLYFGGDELINGLQRWCLWMAGDDFDPADLAKSPILKERVAAVQTKRASRTREATRLAAATPHLFAEIRQPEWDYLALPQSFAEGRRYATAARLSKDVIASIKLFTAKDPDGFLFGVISSSMFITWQKTVGGRIKSDPSVSSSLVWNTLPLPDISEAGRRRIIDAGKAILSARALHPDRTLADAYNPLAMDPALVKAHEKLDREVDRAFGASRKLTTEAQRLEVLFARYAELI